MIQVRSCLAVLLHAAVPTSLSATLPLLHYYPLIPAALLLLFLLLIVHLLSVLRLWFGLVLLLGSSHLCVCSVAVACVCGVRMCVGSLSCRCVVLCAIAGVQCACMLMRWE